MRSTLLFGLLPLAMAAPFEARAPLHVPRDATGDKYIVKMKEGSPCSLGIDAVKPDADSVLPNLGAFSATLDSEDIETLRAHPDVAFVEKEQIMSISTLVSQTNAPWGLARLSSNATGSTTYNYDSTAGAGACVYVIDTGVDATHPEFEGRAQLVANTIDDDSTDYIGHGTHVSGTIASKTYGVAKKAEILAIKVFGESGTSNTSVILAGMDFILGDYKSRAAKCPKGFVVNMSLGGKVSEVIDNAATTILNAGLALASAAGNGDPLTRQPVDASTVSPARVSGVCAVGATDINDKVASFSNYGPLIAVHAPGVDILSTLPGGTSGLQSGTSMASPHVAGLMAYLLGLGATTPSAACDYIVKTALPGRITGLHSDTKNLLAHIPFVFKGGRSCHYRA